MHCGHELAYAESRFTEQKQLFLAGLIGVGVIVAFFMVLANSVSHTKPVHGGRDHQGGYYDSSGAWVAPVGRAGAHTAPEVSPSVRPGSLKPSGPPPRHHGGGPDAIHGWK